MNRTTVADNIHFSSYDGTLLVRWEKVTTKSTKPMNLNFVRNKINFISQRDT